jgi:hypothetical protein
MSTLRSGGLPRAAVVAVSFAEAHGQPERQRTGDRRRARRCALSCRVITGGGNRLDGRPGVADQQPVAEAGDREAVGLARRGGVRDGHAVGDDPGHVALGVSDRGELTRRRVGGRRKRRNG